MDFSGYYANIPHNRCIEVLHYFLEREVKDPEEPRVAKELIGHIFRTFEIDVSRFSDEEIAEMYSGKVDPMLNISVDPGALTGEKMLRKGVDIGNQTSQDIGIIYPHRIDNYAKIILGVDASAKAAFDAVNNPDLYDELIVSELETVDGAVEGYTGEAFPGISVQVVPSELPKCPRCWKRAHVGSDPENPELCDRCAAVLKARA